MKIIKFKSCLECPSKCQKYKDLGSFDRFAFIHNKTLIHPDCTLDDYQEPKTDWLDPVNNPPEENVKYWILCADNSTHKAQCFDKVWVDENDFIIFDVVGYAEYDGGG